MELRTCDLCNNAPAVWLLPCTDYPILTNEHSTLRNLGDWLACTTCGDHVVAGRREALLTHCLAVFPFPDQKVELPLIQECFWRGYQGGRTALGALPPDYLHPVARVEYDDPQTLTRH